MASFEERSAKIKSERDQFFQRTLESWLNVEIEKMMVAHASGMPSSTHGNFLSVMCPGGKLEHFPEFSFELLRAELEKRSEGHAECHFGNGKTITCETWDAERIAHRVQFNGHPIICNFVKKASAE